MSTVLDACPPNTVTFTIPSTIKRISGSQSDINAFYSCSQTLQHFTFDSSDPQLEVIDNYAFHKCIYLQEIDLTSCNHLVSIGDYSFRGCLHVTSILLPDSLTSIGQYCFGEISSVTSFTLPASVKTIQRQLFYRCDKLKTFDIKPKVNSKV